MFLACAARWQVCVCYYNVIMTVITAQVRTGVLAGGRDGGQTKGIMLLAKNDRAPLHTELYALMHTHACMHSQTRRASDTQAETHTNDHLTDINLAPNEPFTMPITDYCYFMRSVMSLDGKTAESLNSFGNVCQRPFRTNFHSP